MNQFGKVRAVKSRLLGVSPVDTHREELEAYLRVVTTIKLAVDRVESILCKLGCLYEDMLDKVEVYYGCENASAFFDLQSALNSVSRVHHELGPIRFGQIRMRISSILAQIEVFEKKLANRDLAYYEKIHYERKCVGGDDPVRFARNAQKRANATTLYAETERIVVFEIDTFLVSKFDSVHAIVEMYARFLADFHSAVATQISLASF